jgi:hypothetical protein
MSVFEISNAAASIYLIQLVSFVEKPVGEVV